MPLPDRAYTDRARAESFGSVAEQYDRYRPSYPDALIADLAALAPDRALDIGCGTGKAAVPMLACGIAVLGVEIDPKMAEVARGHGIIVEVGAFEQWDDRGRTFDLITCGQAWHWIDPDRGAAKAAALLNPGGTLALFWNYFVVEADLQRELDEVYRRIAPEVVRPTASSRGLEDADHAGVLRATGAFRSIETRTYRWHSVLSTDQWLARAATHSDHITLGADRRGELFGELRAVIERRGGTVAADSRSGTFAIFARNPER